MNLTDAEWNVMECLWEKSPRTGRETTEWLEEKMVEPQHDTDTSSAYGEEGGRCRR